MAKIIPLDELEQWRAFAAEYQGDIVRFGIEVCGYKFSKQQIRLLRSVARSRSRTSVASGHGSGKTKALSVICLWHMLCYPQSVTLVTANDMDQLKVTLWKEIGLTVERIRRGDFAWAANYIFVGADLHCHIVGAKDTWFVESKTANAQTANKMAGRHGEWLMVIGDEASTLPDEVTETLQGALSEQHNRMLLTSQYTRLSGFFHRTQTELSTEMGGNWDAMRFSSFDSPWVSNESLKEWMDSYDDDEKRVRIYGLPPEDSGKFMLNLKGALSMYKRGRIIADDEPYGWIVSLDVALGEGWRDKSAMPVGRVVGYRESRRVEIVEIPLYSNKVKANKLPAHLIDTGCEYANPTYVIDKGGLGGVVCQSVDEMNVPLIKVMWGEPCWRKEDSARFLNRRAQATYAASRAAKEGRISILTADHKKELITQASGVPKDHTSNYRLKIPEKGSPAWEGRGSPDLWDAICFMFLDDVGYMIADDMALGGGETVSAVKAAAEEFFGDLDEEEEAV